MSTVLFKPGSVIQKGYSIIIKSWENDGDDYKDEIVKGIQSVELVNQVIHVCKWFTHAEDDMGNDDIRHEQILDQLYDAIGDGIITKDFFDRFLPNVEFPVIGTDEEHDNWLDRIVNSGGYDIVEEMVRTFCGYPVQYDSDFARMIERVEVYYFEEDYVVPSLPKPLVRFDGSWSSRNKAEEWKL